MHQVPAVAKRDVGVVDVVERERARQQQVLRDGDRDRDPKHDERHARGTGAAAADRAGVVTARSGTQQESRAPHVRSRAQEHEVEPVRHERPAESRRSQLASCAPAATVPENSSRMRRPAAS